MTRRSIVSMLPADALLSYGKKVEPKDPMAEALFGRKKPASKKPAPPAPAKKAPARKGKK